MLRKINLAGKFELCLDENMTACCGDVVYDDSINLPGTTSYYQKGEENPKRERGFLTDAYKFEGAAWNRRKFEIDANENERVFVYLERTRISEVFVNGKAAGREESFCAPHLHEVTKLLIKGENLLEIRICNKGYKTGGGHMTSPDTQSNWNGVTGEISLRIYSKTHARNVFIESDIKRRGVRIKCDIAGNPNGKLTVRALDFKSGSEVYAPKNYTYTNGKADVFFAMPEAKLWSEFSPDLYKIELSIGNDREEFTVGLREFTTDGRFFTINGKKTFLRGKHDGLIFPKTGFAPTEVDEWLKVLEISKSYGINHYRFHTCCPPEAAFTAADMLGIYFEPQLPFWGTITTENDENHNAAEQEFLVLEGFKMMAAFGNHPSFCMMSMGNELWGSTERINQIMAGYKAVDRRHLYTQGSNNFQWFPNVLPNDDFFVGVRLANDRLIRGSYAMCDAPQGHIQVCRPTANHNYDRAIIPESAAKSTEVSADGTVQIQFGTTMKTVKSSDANADFIPEIPIVTHEIGQYETFPDFDEIKKYTGPLKARNFEEFAKTMQEKGLYPLWRDFFKASGKLAAACYKEELESIFRSNLIAGFQLLDLQDFSGQGTALVGILNAFMENKGNITAEKWREFCSESVLLCEFPSYTYQSGEEINTKIRLVNFSERSFDGVAVRLTLTLGDECQNFDTVIRESGENFIDIGEFTFKLPEIAAPSKCELSVCTLDSLLHNSYNLWVYPKTDNIDKENLHIFDSVNDEARRLLDEGKTVLILPDVSALIASEKALKGTYCTDFWCYPMFSSISKMMNKPLPIGTMGLLIDSKHPSLAEFPCEFYTTPQWWEIVENSACEILDEKEGKRHVVVRMIDNFERCHSLGVVYEHPCGKGKVVKVNVDFAKISHTPEGRWFIKSICDYAAN